MKKGKGLLIVMKEEGIKVEYISKNLPSKKELRKTIRDFLHNMAL